jgi:hypothetical protein
LSKRNKERRRLRQEQKRQPPAPSENGNLTQTYHEFEQKNKAPDAAPWPGVSDPALARPDMVKLDLFRFAIETEPGRSKRRHLERRLAEGIFGQIGDWKHWAMEELTWHGLPGDSWHPIEAFLAHQADRFSPAAAAQLRLWKEARIGFFEIGAVADDRVTLREFDPLAQRAVGSDFQAIALNIGGASFYRDHMDDIHLTYVARWAPDEALFCAMGYGLILTPQEAPAYLPVLGLRQPDVLARPLPWKASPAERVRYHQEWRQRDWPAWLGQQLQVPFWALTFGPMAQMSVYEIKALLPATAEEFQDFGLYFEVQLGKELGRVGATAVIPIDPSSPQSMPLAEYRAYRDLVGPPRAVR